MRVQHGYVEIEGPVSDVSAFGEWVAFIDADGQEVHITPEVVAQLCTTAFAVAEEMAQAKENAMPRSEMLALLMPALIV